MGCGSSKPPPEAPIPTVWSPRSHSSSSTKSSKSKASYTNWESNDLITIDYTGKAKDDDKNAEPLLKLEEEKVEPEVQKKDENREEERESIKNLELIKVPEGNDNKTEENNEAKIEEGKLTNEDDKNSNILVKPEENTDDNETEKKHTERENIIQTPEPRPDEGGDFTESTEKQSEENTEKPEEEKIETPAEENTGHLAEENTEKPAEEKTEEPVENTENTEHPPEENIEMPAVPPEENQELPAVPPAEDTETVLREKTMDAARETGSAGIEREVVKPTVDENYDDIDDGYDDLYTPFDDEEEEDLEIEGYVQNDLGLMIKTIQFHREYEDDEEDQRPSVQPGELYTDKDFPLDIAIVRDSSAIEWKRPGEFLSEPVLFHDDTTRFDIGQGSAGTCWFLSTVSTLAGNADMISQVIPKDAYNIDNSEAYDGVFHARFFRFGKWEDIYIDDYIPVLYGNVPWGAKSSTHENEVWVSLLEKAFARLHGSYDSIYGGQPGDAYLQLTGGIGERVELDGQGNQDKQLFRRVTNALNSGSQVTCVVPDEFDEYQGLVGGHAYSLVGTAVINGTKLVRVRNPWGRGEWTGPWSDGSAEFDTISSSSEKVPNKDDGEFYISLQDFMRCFSQTTICSLTPDFDCDGKSDPMNFILNLYGEWTAEKMGGFQEMLKNPRFSFTVTEEGMLEDGTVPMLIQMVQHTKKRKTGNASIRCDVFKIKGDKVRPTGRTIAAEIQGKKNNVYTTELQSSFRHRLKPGRYMAVPSTCDGNVKKAFLLRIYTPAPLKNCKEVGIDANILSCENEESLTHDGHTYDLTFDKTLFGAFVSGVNAGGQVSNRETYAINPQYLISIPNTGTEVPLVVHVMQTQEEPQYPVGFRLFNLDRGVNPPVSVDYLYDKYNSSPTDIEGNNSRFMISWDVDVRYLLPAGRYVALIHMDQPDTEKAFAIVFKSNTNIGIKGLQTGE